MSPTFRFASAVALLGGLACNQEQPSIAETEARAREQAAAEAAAKAEAQEPPPPADPPAPPPASPPSSEVQPPPSSDLAFEPLIELLGKEHPALAPLPCGPFDADAKKLVDAKQIVASGTFVTVPFPELSQTDIESWVCQDYSGIPGEVRPSAIAFASSPGFIEVGLDRAYSSSDAARPDFDASVATLSKLCASHDSKQPDSHDFESCGNAGFARVAIVRDVDQFILEVWFAPSRAEYERMMKLWNGAPPG